MKVGGSSGFNYVDTTSGSSGFLQTQSYLYYTPPNDPDGETTFWPLWSDGSSGSPTNQGEQIQAKNIPAC